MAENRLKRRGTQAQVAPFAGILGMLVDLFAVGGTPGDATWQLHAVTIGGGMLYGLIMFGLEKWGDNAKVKAESDKVRAFAETLKSASADGRIDTDEVKSLLSEGVDIGFSLFEGESQTDPSVEYDPNSPERGS